MRTETDARWRRHVLGLIDRFRESYLRAVPTDSAELESTVDTAERLIAGESSNVGPLLERAVALGNEYDQLNSHVLSPNYDPPQHLSRAWIPIVATIASTGAIVYDIEQWVDRAPTDDVLGTLEQTVDAVDDRPSDVPWLAHRALRTAVGRGRHLSEANEFLKTAEGFSFSHPDDSYPAVRTAVQETIRDGDFLRFKQLRSSLLEAKERQWKQADLDSFDSSNQEFEELLAALWETYGYHTDVTSKTNDGGFDVIARDGESLLLIEAKHWDDDVDGGTVNGVAGLLPQYEADRVVLVSSSGFTQPAIDRARRADLVLVSGVELRERLTASPLLTPLERSISGSR